MSSKIKEADTVAVQAIRTAAPVAGLTYIREIGLPDAFLDPSSPLLSVGFVVTSVLFVFSAGATS